jgi:hypothetical protein
MARRCFLRLLTDSDQYVVVTIIIIIIIIIKLDNISLQIWAIINLFSSVIFVIMKQY